MNINLYDNVELPEADAIFKVVEAYKKDESLKKVNLAIGVLVDENLKVEVPDCVKLAMEQAVSDCQNISGYLPISGLKELTDSASVLLFGDTFSKERTFSIQAPGGTGCLRLIGEFIKTYGNLNSANEIFVSNPSWGNHKAIFEQLGFKVGYYDYFSKENSCFTFNECINSLEKLPENSLVLLHASSHNPTGCDPTKEEWNSIIEVLVAKSLIPIVDCAYQGLGVSIDSDAYVIRELAKLDLNFFVAQSFSKSLALYQQRTGVAHAVLSNPAQYKATFESAKLIARKMYSNPPAFGAYVANRVLTDSILKAEWEEFLKTVRDRLGNLREELCKGLEDRGVKFNFNAIRKQIGMFALLPLSKEQAIKLKENSSVYILESGRICLAALNKNNIDYVIESISGVVE